MPERNITLADLEGLGLVEFDPAEYITSDEAAAAYITQALETNDAAVFAAAVGDVARARGMAEIARASGLAREGLYKALRPNSQPRMETITRVLSAMNVRLKAEVIPVAERALDVSVALAADVASAKAARKPAVKAGVARVVRARAGSAELKEKVDVKPTAKVQAKRTPKPAAKKPSGAQARLTRA
jgi:probable addiction module antidote protein